jgi:hypothetical protein
VAALHATVAEGVQVAISANSNKEWLVGVQVSSFVFLSIVSLLFNSLRNQRQQQ